VLDPAARRDIDALLAGLAKHFDELCRGVATAVPAHLVERLDAVVTAILRLADPEDRYAGVGVAVGFRRALLPRAPGYGLTGAAS
jgi:hypothetical protein